MTLSADQDPDDLVRKLEVNIQLPDGPPPVQAPHPFQVRFQHGLVFFFLARTWQISKSVAVDVCPFFASKARFALASVC